MATNLTYTGELTVVTCWCGTAHAVPTELRNYQLREHADGRKFNLWCPLGHEYHPSGRSKWEIEQERARTAEADLARARAQLTSTKDQLAAERKGAKAARQRTANGVCPCCKRSFVQLTRHMASKHPGYTP